MIRSVYSYQSGVCWSPNKNNNLFPLLSYVFVYIYNAGADLRVTFLEKMENATTTTSRECW
jgi:hypothetical protein